ncbi:hypothetical protein WA158_006463 [Blastocystis sp. Blastoise]
MFIAYVYLIRKLFGNSSFVKSVQLLTRTLFHASTVLYSSLDIYINNILFSPFITQYISVEDYDTVLSLYINLCCENKKILQTIPLFKIMYCFFFTFMKDKEEGSYINTFINLYPMLTQLITLYLCEPTTQTPSIIIYYKFICFCMFHKINFQAIKLYFEYYHTVVTSTPNLYKILATSQNPFMIYILLYKNYPDILINDVSIIYMLVQGTHLFDIYIYRNNSEDSKITKQYRSIINFIYDIIHITNYMDTKICDYIYKCLRYENDDNIYLFKDILLLYLAALTKLDDQDKLTGYLTTLSLDIKRSKDLDNLVDDHISDEVYIKMLQRWQRDIYILANICHKDSASIQMIIEIYFSLLTPSFSNPYIIQQLFTSTLLDAFYILTPFYKPEVMHKLFLEKKININGINMNSINTNATTNNNMPIVSSINNTNNNTTLNNNIIGNKLLGHSYPSSIRISTPSTHIGTSIYIPPSLSATPPSSIPLSLSNLQYNSQHHLMKQDSNSSYHENNDCVSSPILDSSISNSATPPPASNNILINNNKLYVDTTTSNNIHSFSHNLSGSNRNSLDPLEYDSEIPFPKASITPMPSSTSVSPYEVNNTNEIVFDGDRNEIYTTTTQGNSSSFSEIRPLNMDIIYKEADNDIEISPLSKSTSPIPLKRINSISNGELFENDNNNTNNNTNDNNDKNIIPHNVNRPLSAHLSSTISNQINSTLQSSDLNTCIDYTYDIHNNRSASNILLTPTNKDRIAISHHNNIIT